MQNSNNESLFPLYVFGPIQYWKEIIRYKAVTLEVHEHFLKQTPRSRYSIYGSSGEQKLSVLLKNKSSKSALKDIRLSYDEDWKKQHIKSLVTAYSSSPFFEFYLDDIQDLYSRKHSFLVDFGQEAFYLTQEFLQYEIEAKLSKSYYKLPSGNDFRSFDFVNSFDELQYNQVNMDVGAPFIPNLSILDLLFNKGPESLSILLSKS